MTSVPSMISRDPSSLVMRKSWVPAVATLRLPVTSVTNRSAMPKWSAVDQLMVGMSLSMLGVWPGLSVQ